MLFFLKRNIPLTNAFLDAIGVERMDFVLLVDSSWSTPSRGWTEFNPMERMFNPPVQFEVRRSIVFCRIYRS